MTILHDTSDTEKLASDRHARTAALDPTQSFIVDAPAGAGKTELLTQRFLQLLAHVDEPEEVLALTFTRKAAAEMRDRIMSSLDSARTPAQDEMLEHKRTTHKLATAVLKKNSRCHWQLLNQPGRLRVLTLDALSMSLARQMPLLTRFGGQPGLSTTCQPLYEQAARETLALLDAPGATEHDKETLSRVLDYFDNHAGLLQNMLVAMLARRDQWQLHGHTLEADQLQWAVSWAFGQMVERELQDIAATLNRVLTNEVIAAARHAAEHSPDSPIHALHDWHTALPCAASELPLWRSVAELFLTKDDRLRKLYRSPINLTGKEHKAAKETLMEVLAQLESLPDAVQALARIRKLPDPELDDAQAEIVQDLAHLLKLAKSHLWLTFIQEKTVDPIEISERALKALGSDDAPTDLALQLDYQIRHLLVDEFQDTSPSQVALLKKLTAGWSPGSGQTLFLVGDPMQSIYRFRKADVGLFIRVRENGIGPQKLTPLRLYQNNRSAKNIVDWVNQTFVTLFPPQEDAMRGAVSFSPSVAKIPLSDDANVCIHPIIREDATTDDIEDADSTPIDSPSAQADQQEAELIVQLIRQARQSHPEGTVAVLVRARSHLIALSKRLRAQTDPEPFQAVEIDTLITRQPIQDLVALTRALHHQADRVHWLAILRAPWCGLLLADLHALAADPTHQTLWARMQDEALIDTLSADGQYRLRHLRQKIADAYAARSLQRPRRWVEGVWQALGGKACLSETSDYDDVRAYFQLLDQLEHHGTLDLTQLDDGLTRLFAAPDTTPESRHVQLMTIHKSKGLQFDTVILPGLHKTLPGDDKVLLLWDTVLLDDQEEHLLVAPVPPITAAKATGPTPYDFLQDFEKSRQRNEAQRVLYVAATRAERQLHLLGAASCDDKAPETHALKAPPKASLLALLWPHVLPTFQRAAAESATQPITPSVAIDAAQFSPPLIRLTTAHLPGTLPPLPHSASDTPTPAPTAQPDDTLEMALGTLVHRYLEAIACDGLDAWPITRLDAMLPTFARTLRRDGFTPAECQTAAQRVLQNLQGALSSEKGQWILGSHESAGCEIAMSQPHAQLADTTTHQVIDRTFIEDGIRWIIDYKTLDAETLSESLVKDKTELYRPQLERYAALFTNEGLPIRKALFFPAFGRLEIVA